MLNINFKYYAAGGYPFKPFKVEDHIHPYYELVYYTEGSGKSIIERKEFDYKPGTYIIVPAGIHHSEVIFTPSKHLRIGFDFLDINTVLPRLLYKDTPDNRIFKLLNEIREEYTAALPFYTLRLDLLTQDILAYTMRSYCAPAERSADAQMKMAVTYLDTYHTTNIDLKELAASVNYSYDRFRHLFKAYTGYTLKQYIINKRVETAKTYLKNTDEPIARIAIRCGFDSASHFISTFKASEGVSPNHYRNRAILDMDLIEYT